MQILLDFKTKYHGLINWKLFFAERNIYHYCKMIMQVLAFLERLITEQDFTQDRFLQL